MRLSVHFASSEEADNLVASNPDIAEIDGAHDKGELLVRMGAALEFPDYFGENWDAFDECLRELPSATLLIRDAASLWISMPAEMITLVDIWSAAARDSREGLDLIFVF